MNNLLSTEQYRALYAHLESKLYHCSHTLRMTRAWLHSQDMDIRANIEKIYDLGGHCDCEVLMNVTPRDWQARRDEPLMMHDIFEVAECDEMVSRAMLRAAPGGGRVSDK